MTKHIWGTAFSLTALIAAASWNAADAQVRASSIPEGRLYAVHTRASGGCPAIDWHVVVRPGGVLEGWVAWNDMESMARVKGTAFASGQLVPFHMDAVETGGQGRTASIDGSIRPNGRLVANIKGPNVDCRGITVPFTNPNQGSAGGGG